jgi:outer membrane protein assembly factor BamB
MNPFKPMRLEHLISRLLLVSLAVPSTLGANPDQYDRNWPQWRGPGGNGLVVHGNPPLEWSETQHLKWKVPIPGRGHATPIIWEDKIVVLTAVPSDTGAAVPAATAERPAAQPQRGGPGRGPGGGRSGGRGGGGMAPTTDYSFTVLCFDRATGEQLWERVARQERPHQGIQPSNSFSSGSPVTDGERIYASFGSSGLYCYDFEGNLIWEKDLGKVNVTFGEGSSPTLVGDTLLMVQDNNNASFLYALDKKTGRELWKQPRDEGSGWTTPFVLEHGGRTEAIISGSNAVRSYDPASGNVWWQCAGLGSNPVSMVVADDEAVYAMSGHNSPAGMAIALGRSGDLTGTDAVRWRIGRGTSYVPSPLLYDGLLFFCQRTSGILTCLDAKTGAVHFEQHRLEDLADVYASPIGVNDRVYLAGQNGTTLVLEKANEVRILASNKLDDGFDASPAVVGNELFLRGRSNLYCIAQD